MPDVDRFIAVSDYYVPVMSRLLGIPADRMAVVPLGINLAGYERRASPTTTSFRVGYFARIAPEKGLHVLADAYVQFRQRTAGAPVRLEAAGYLSRAHEPYLEEVRRSLDRAGLGRRVHLSRRRRSRRQAGVSALARRAVGAGDLRRAEGRVPARGDGERRPGRAAAARRVHRDRREDRRRSARRARRSGGAGRWLVPAVAGSRAAATRSASARFDGVRAHYSIAHSADRLLEVYEAVHDGPSDARGRAQSSETCTIEPQSREIAENS